MTRATYEAMHREIKAVRWLEFEQGMAKELGISAAEFHERFLAVKEEIADLMDETEEPSDNVIQGPW